MNDNLPELTLPLIISPIPETLVVVLSISDLDPGDNGRMTCSTEREATLAPEILCRKILYCNVRGALDQEQQAKYNFTIIVIDLGSPMLKM